MRSIASNGAVVVLLTLGMAAGVTPASAGQQTPYLDLGKISEVVSSEALDVSNAGFVVGVSSAGPGGAYVPTNWDRAGRLTVLKTLPDSAEVPRPSAVNDLGQAIGTVSQADGGRRALRWNRDGEVTVLEAPPGAAFLGANALNNRGVVLGGAGSNPLVGQVVRWDRAGKVTVLPELPGLRWPFGIAINDHGIAIGGGYDPQDYIHPWLWDRAGVPHKLDPPPGVGPALLTDLNDRGHVIGNVGAGGIGGVVWDPAGHGTVLPGQGVSVAQINERGTILGSAYFEDLGTTTAVRWRDGRLTRLALPPTGRLAYAIDQSDNDITIGRAVLSPYREVPVWWDRDGEVHDFACPSATIPCTVNAVNAQGIAVGSGMVETGAGTFQHALAWRLRR